MQKISLLMVEDHPSDGDLALAALERGELAFRCDRVDSRQEFERALKSGTYDVILAENSLRDLSGIEALHIAKTEAPDTPLIFLSGALSEDSAIELIQRGATDYVLKDRLERLRPAVLRALSEAREKRRAAKAEEALRESEARYRLLVEFVPQLIWTCSSQGECDFLNARWREYTGVSEQAQLGYGWLQAVHPEDREQTLQRWNEAVRSGHEFETEYRLRDGQGRYRWFKARAVPVSNESGQPLKWFGSSTDIHNEKLAEAAIFQKSEALARSNADLQQFAYVASHDLQEPLRTVISYTQLLQKRYQGRLDEDADEFIRYAVEGAIRMQRLIHDLLDYSRASREGDYAYKPVSAEKALRIALANLSALVTESGAQVSHDPLPTVIANESQLSQVFQNLISNAIKYRSAEQPRVQISAARDGQYWILSVQDNGQGFDPCQAQRIFGIFQRLHGHDVPGTGMGLAICKRMIEAHGGRIWAISEPGRGATFSFSLRAADQKPEA